MQETFRKTRDGTIVEQMQWQFCLNLSSLNLWPLGCQNLMFPCLLALVVCLVGFLTSLSTTRLYRGRAPRQSVWQFYVLANKRQSWETMTSVSAGHIILTPTQPVGSGNRTRDVLTSSHPLSYRAPLSLGSWRKVWWLAARMEYLHHPKKKKEVLFTYCTDLAVHIGTTSALSV